MSPYELDNRFDVSTLSRLELAGIPVSASLEKNCEKLSEIIGVSCDGYRGYHSMMAEWMKSEGNRYPPYLEVTSRYFERAELGGAQSRD